MARWLSKDGFFCRGRDPALARDWMPTMTQMQAKLTTALVCCTAPPLWDQLGTLASSSNALLSCQLIHHSVIVQKGLLSPKLEQQRRWFAALRLHHGIKLERWRPRIMH